MKLGGREGRKNELLKEESRESHGTIVLSGVKYVSVGWKWMVLVVLWSNRNFYAINFGEVIW